MPIVTSKHAATRSRCRPIPFVAVRRGDRMRLVSHRMSAFVWPVARLAHGSFDDAARSPPAPSFFPAAASGELDLETGP